MVSNGIINCVENLNTVFDLFFVPIEMHECYMAKVI